MVEINDQDAASWKQRYLTALDQADQRDSEWQEVDNLLRQCISRLTLAADTSDERLNHQLDELRAAIRGGHESAQLKGLIDSLSDTILRLDEARKSNPIPTLAEFSIELLNTIQFPKGQRHRATVLIKQLAEDSNNLDHGTIVSLISGLLSEVFVWAMDDAKRDNSSRNGLLGKFLKRKGGDQETATDSPPSPTSEGLRRLIEKVIATSLIPPSERAPLLAALEHNIQISALDQLAWEIVDLLKQRGSAPDTTSPGEALIQLLERLDIPDEFSATSARIRQMLLTDESASGVSQQVTAMGGLISAIRQTMQGEREELENFLLQLTDRLGELDQEVQGGLELHRTTVTGGRELGESVVAEMQTIEESVKQAQDLSTIKQTIQQRVDIIRDNMEAFREAEEQRLIQAENQVSTLTQRLSQMERESGELRRRVTDARALAEIDTLTQLPNRLAYNQRIAQEYSRWRRYHSPLSLCVVDIDLFKRVNDSYGHQAGDKVLAVIAKVLAKQVRDTDFVARFGGEEFILLMPETTLQAALQVADVLRESIAQCEFHFKGNPVPITASCGIAEFRQGDTIDPVFKRADLALYQAKQQGRNCCRTATD